MATCCSRGLDAYEDWISPLGIVHRQEVVARFYRDYPIFSRVVAIPVGLVSGMAEPFLFPMKNAVAFVAMPVIALFEYCLDRPNKTYEASDWLHAWCFSAIGTVASILIMGVCVYYLPLVATSAIMVVVFSVSVVYHVHKFAKEPVPTPKNDYVIVN